MNMDELKNENLMLRDLLQNRVPMKCIAETTYQPILDENEKLKGENKKLKKENKINKQVIKILNKKAEELKKAKDKVNIEDMFNIWRELQMEMNPQYSIDDEVNFLLHRHPKWYPLAKEVFEDLYPAEFILDIETKTYREWTEEDE